MRRQEAASPDDHYPTPPAHALIAVGYRINDLVVIHLAVKKLRAAATLNLWLVQSMTVDAQRLQYNELPATRRRAHLGLYRQQQPESSHLQHERAQNVLLM